MGEFKDKVVIVTVGTLPSIFPSVPVFRPKGTAGLIELRKSNPKQYGASSGFGKATSLAFAKEGSFLSITSLAGENLQDVAEQCHKAGVPEGKVLALEVDLTNDEDCNRLIEETVHHFGKIDILINNAGVLRSGVIDKADMKEFDLMFRLNVRTVYLLMKLALPYLTLTKGSVVNIGSCAGTTTIGGLSPYCMTKAAVNKMTQDVALEVAERGVRVNCINPGVVETNLYASFLELYPQKELFELLKEKHALKTFGTVDHIVAAILFLTSEKSSFTTGASLSVDGGFNLQGPIFK